MACLKKNKEPPTSPISMVHVPPARFQDEDLLVLAKPAGKLAWEDSRHRHERGTALKVEADAWKGAG